MLNKKSIVALLCAAIVAAGTASTVFAQDLDLIKTQTAVATSAPAAAQEKKSYTTDFAYNDVRSIAVINRDLQVGYNVTNAYDRAQILNALNAIDCSGNLNVKEEMDGLVLLRILMNDGTAHNFWCHPNVFMIEDKQVATASQAKALYTLLTKCQQNYYAGIEWLAYMNPYRITTMEVTANGKGRAVYQSAMSDTQRKVILDIASRLSNVKVGSVQKLEKIDPKTYGDGKLTYSIHLDFENGKEGYNIYIFDDKRITVSVDSINYDLTYVANDDYLLKSLTSALDANL